MAEVYYKCSECGSDMHYRTTKHNGCPSCEFMPLHGAD